MDWVSDQYPEISIIVLSSDTSTQRVVNAMRRNPTHFITKPSFYLRDLKTAIESALLARRKSDKMTIAGFQFQTHSPQVKAILNDINRIATRGLRAPILILGESGTGKEFLAKHIASRFHRPSSRQIWLEFQRKQQNQSYLAMSKAHLPKPTWTSQA